MQDPIRQKWRPPLALVVGGTLAVVFFLPIIGIGYFKLAGFILGWGETTLMIFVMALVATGMLGFLLWRLVLRPVWALTAHANAVRDGRRDAPLPTRFGTPEITALSRAVYEMGTTLQDREAGLRAYTNHVTHELKSPLTSLIGAAELLPEADATDRAQLTETIRQSARKLEEQLNALRRLAAAREPVGRGPASLAEAAADVAAETGLAIDCAGGVSLPIDPGSLRAVLTHLAQNALAHGADRLQITAEGQTVTLRDNGRGIAPGNRDRVFDPFFTTRRESGGTGMGLAIVRTLLRAAGGEIALAQSETGAAFTLRFG